MSTLNDIKPYLFYLEGDITVPVTLQCGGFVQGIQDLVLWFSSGGTKSVLHSDYLDNINCLLDGTKEIIFIDKVLMNYTSPNLLQFSDCRTLQIRKYLIAMVTCSGQKQRSFIDPSHHHHCSFNFFHAYSYS